MTLPSKGTRTVDVDGKAFRFMVKEKSSDNEKELSVTVQEDTDKPGRPMQFTWPYGHAVTPEDVRMAVRDGRKEGWDPSSRGGAFILAQERCHGLQKTDQSR